MRQVIVDSCMLNVYNEYVNAMVSEMQEIEEAHNEIRSAVVPLAGNMLDLVSVIVSVYEYQTITIGGIDLVFT